MNKLGRNKTLWLKKNGCVFKEERDDGIGFSSTAVYTTDGEYVTLADLGEKAYCVNFIYRHRLTQLSSIGKALGKPTCKYTSHTVSIGFSEKEQAWYGWTHRGFGKFYVGYEVQKGSIMDYGWHKHPFTVKTLDEAKKLACFIADYLD